MGPLITAPKGVAKVGLGTVLVGGSDVATAGTAVWVEIGDDIVPLAAGDAVDSSEATSERGNAPGLAGAEVTRPEDDCSEVLGATKVATGRRDI